MGLPNSSQWIIICNLEVSSFAFSRFEGGWEGFSNSEVSPCGASTGNDLPQLRSSPGELRTVKLTLSLG